jgi:hypothetical protein
MLVAWLSVGCGSYTWRVESTPILAVEDGVSRKYHILHASENTYAAKFNPAGRYLLEDEGEMSRPEANAMPLWPRDMSSVTDDFIRVVSGFDWPWYRIPGAVRGALQTSPDRHTWTPSKYVISLRPFMIASYNWKVGGVGNNVPESPDALRVEDPLAQPYADSAVKDAASPTLVSESARSIMVNVILLCKDRNASTKGSVLPDELWVLRKPMPVTSVVEYLSHPDFRNEFVLKRYKL